MSREWYRLSAEEVLAELETSQDGLSTGEASARLKRDGKNELPRKKRDSFWKILLRQLVGPMEILLLVAMGVSFVIGEVVDGCAILVIITLDLVMGTVQEWKAGKTAESLANLIRVQTKVLRDGREIVIDASELVAGDIVLLESGNKVSADLRVLGAVNLQIDESVLTGESLSVAKTADIIAKDAVPLMEQRNMAFAGTNVLTGRARAVVVRTGRDTEVGQIAQEVATVKEPKSPLMIRMEKFSRQIAIMVVLVAVLIGMILLAKGTSGGEIMLAVIALAVSAMPEGLALALTMALTIASNKMGKQNVIVKRLNAVESLGSCTVIASDKTGTLTVNEQTAKRILLPDGAQYYIEGTGYNDYGKVVAEAGADLERAKRVAWMGVLNNEAKLVKRDGEFVTTGDSIDVAFLALGRKLGIEKVQVEVTGRVPYESENKYSAVFYKEEGKKRYTIKGSVETVLELAEVDQTERAKIEQQNEDLAREGYRVIALADGEADAKLEFLGLVGFIDPVRTEARAAVAECQQAGIKVMMITGDHPLTAYAIAGELGLVKDYAEVTTGAEVDKWQARGDKEFDKFVRGKSVFTRVTPLNKLAIVESLKRRGEFVAVTGDGVNDAPALKAANIGVAMGSGTDVAKETADLIVLDDNFRSIVAGVREGRTAYANIRKVSYMLLSCGVAEVLFFVLAIIGDMPMPLVAIQLLWLNMVTDGLQDFALSFERPEAGIMKQKPRSPKESIFDKELIREVLVAGLTMGAIVFLVWLYLIKGIGMEVQQARGYVMVLMVFMQNLHVLNCRSERQSAFKIPLRQNWWVVVAIASALILQVIVSEVPALSQVMQTSSVPVLALAVLLMISTSVLWVVEIYKKLAKRRKFAILDIALILRGIWRIIKLW